MFAEALQSFLAAGWLPDPLCEREFLPGGNLLPALDQAWGRRCSPRRAWLARHLAEGASLTWGPPGHGGSFGERLAEPHAGRFFFWLHAPPGRPWWGIVSSRLGLRLDQKPEWFAAFRAVCGEAMARGATLLSGEGTTTARFVRRAAVAIGNPVMLLHAPRATETIDGWLRRMSRIQPAPLGSGSAYEGYVSPLLASDETVPVPASSPAMSSSPWIDRAVVAAADHLYLLHLRRGGNLEPVIRRRMAELTAENDPCVSIFANDRCIAPPLAAELVTVGGRLWKPAIEQTPDGERPDGERPGQCGRGPLPVPGAAVAYPPSSPAAVLGWQEFRAARAEEPWPYLTHCTRAPSGRWPDQTESDYLDELLRGECAERSALAALCRILMQQRIWGTKSALRGGFSAVCLTEVSPAELSALRQYQPQRLRWDFEPYAVAILRDWLAERGARPVQYGDERTWEQLPEADRPFFQIKETRRRRRPMSWSREREWRLPGDLELSALPSDAACVLVPSFKEAERVAPMSRWPIVVCPGG